MKSAPRIFALVLIIIAFSFNACEKSEPDVPVSDREKFLGTYTAESDGPVSGPRNFNLVISASVSAPDQIKMVNFDDSNGTTVFASVSGSSLSISSQTISNDTYQGTGSISGNTLTINFTVDDGQTVEHRVLSGQK
jgi:hypothetical protein